jgi:carbon storage regulator
LHDPHGHGIEFAWLLSVGHGEMATIHAEGQGMLVDPSSTVQGGIVMLVLSRKIGERICIGQDVVVTVVAIRGGRIQLGIQAPDQVTILREEIAFDRPLVCAGHKEDQADVYESAYESAW